MKKKISCGKKLVSLKKGHNLDKNPYIINDVYTETCPRFEILALKKHRNWTITNNPILLIIGSLLIAQTRKFFLCQKLNFESISVWYSLCKNRVYYFPFFQKDKLYFTVA